MVSTYLDTLRLFSHDVRMYLITSALIGIGFFGIGGHLVHALHELVGTGFEFGFVKLAAERLEIDIHVSITLKKSADSNNFHP